MSQREAGVPGARRHRHLFARLHLEQLQSEDSVTTVSHLKCRAALSKTVQHPPTPTNTPPPLFLTSKQAV